MEGRPPLAASSLQNPTQLRCFRAERGHRRFGVVTWVPIIPSGRPLGVRGRVLLHPTLSLGVRVTPPQSPP